jgi:LysM repeat protein
LGRHSKPSRIRIPHRVPAAAPAIAGLAGVAAAVALAPPAFADTSTAGAATTPLAATADAASMLGPAPQLLDAIARPAQLDQAAASQSSTYTVHSGDTLSKIAASKYQDQGAWPVLYYANRSEIHWANVIQPGQVLKIPAKPSKIPSAPGQLGPQAAVVASSSSVSSARTSTASASTSTRHVSSSSTYSGGTPGGSFGACVVSRESGGNAQVMNSSGHYGLYQFSESTWEAYGGSAGSFGHASASEQNRVFSNALAAGGQSNWAPYDGC